MPMQERLEQDGVCPFGNGSWRKVAEPGINLVRPSGLGNLYSSIGCFKLSEAWKITELQIDLCGRKSLQVVKPFNALLMLVEAISAFHRLEKGYPGVQGFGWALTNLSLMVPHIWQSCGLDLLEICWTNEALDFVQNIRCWCGSSHATQNVFELPIFGLPKSSAQLIGNAMKFAVCSNTAAQQPCIVLPEKPPSTVTAGRDLRAEKQTSSISCFWRLEMSLSAFLVANLVRP